jgi:hypothetical protein
MSAVDTRRERAWHGVQAWSRFPATREPRPLVLLAPPVSAGGFPDGQKKMAFLSGRVNALTGFPAPLAEALRQPRVTTKYAGPALTVSSAVLASHVFCTDRGRLQLPAWEVRAIDVPEPIWVLDPVVAKQVWQPSGSYMPDWAGSAAVLEPGGHTLTMTFIGSPYFDYTGVEVIERGAAVAIIPLSVLTPRLRASPSGSAARGVPLPGQPCQVTVTLAQPLANRVILDDSGSPVMVAT